MGSQKNTVVLFTYGGGMRGLIPAQIMCAIEERTGLQMAQMVDVFTGPSTGAILNTALNIPHPERPNQAKWRAKHLVLFYEREGIRIFPPDRFRDLRSLLHDVNNRTIKIGHLQSLVSHGHYDPAYLKKCLGDLFGDTRIENSLSNLIIPIFNIDGAHPELYESGELTEQDNPDSGGYAVWLKNMKLPGGKREVTDVRLQDAVLGSCSAPTYFPCHHFNVDDKEYAAIDGSIFDNPCMTYYGALKPNLPKNSELTMIMLGTGHTLQSFKKEDWNSYGSLGVVDPVNNLPLINILMHASETALLEGFLEEMDDRAHVLNKQLFDHPALPNSDLDDASADNLKKMQRFAQELMEENTGEMDRICDVLVRNYEHKQNAPRKRKWFSFTGQKPA